MFSNDIVGLLVARLLTKLTRGCHTIYIYLTPYIVFDYGQVILVSNLICSKYKNLI